MSPIPTTDTITAIATPSGRGAIGVVRLSGPDVARIANTLCGALPAPRVAALRSFRDADGNTIDRGLILYFPAPHSFTGEDVVELQSHGGPVVLDTLLRATCNAGARIARPGEFSERAFLNDRLDLAQAEAIADLIDAGTRDAARAAIRSLDGELSRRVERLTAELVSLRVFVEGALDFSDEDIDWLADAGLRTRVEALRQQIAQLLKEADQGRRLRDGLTVALTGRPNVGKSTLLNRLAGADVAIVTDIPGTTRDVLRENLDLGGLPLTVVDTAGLRESSDVVEQEGVRRARRALDHAEVALFLLEAPQGLTPEDAALLCSLPEGLQRIVLHNKSDLLRGNAPQRWVEDGVVHLSLSAADGRGIDALIHELHQLAGISDSTEGSFSARTRHVDALRRTLAFVQDAEQRLRDGADVELAAEELRLAQDALGEITGRISSDDLLGEIFSRFCIGK